MLATELKILEINSSNTNVYLNKLSASKITPPLSYMFFLNSTGRYIADTFFLQHQERTFLISKQNILERLQAHLQHFDIRKEMEYTWPEERHDLEDMSHSDKRAPHMVDQDTRAVPNIYWSLEDVGYKDPRGLGSLVLSENKLETTINSTYQNARINAEIAEFEDFEFERSIILEFGQISSFISHDKGCYPGQELMHRTFTQGVIRKTVKRTHELDETIIRVLAKNDDNDNDNDNFNILALCKRI